MNANAAAVPARRLTQTEVFVGEVLPPDREEEVLRALPAGIDPLRFKHSLTIACMQNPALLKLHPGLVFREVAKAASLGLSMDPQLGESYIVVVRNGKAQRDEPQLRIGYRGLMRLARQSSEISLIYAHAVHELDPFHIKLGAEFALEHEPDVFHERGDVIGYYAVMRFRNGDYDFEPMALSEIHKIRDRTDGWKAFKAGRIKSTPWSEFETEMARKTVLRRLLKRAPMSPEMAAALKLINEEEEEGLGAEPEEKRALAGPRATRAAQLRALAQGHPESAEEESAADAEQGAIEDGDYADPSQAETATASGEASTGESAEINRTSEEYERGARDFEAGLKKCVSTAIRDNPARLRLWQAGFDEAREAAEANAGAEP
jgi:recombination protein RecT